MARPRSNFSDAADMPDRLVRGAEAQKLRFRALAVVLGVAALFATVSAQLVRLALNGGEEIVVSQSQPVTTAFARPDIIDRNGRLLATDIAMPSLYADPALVLNRDEVVESLAPVLPSLDSGGLRHSLGEEGRRFVWVRRGLSPRLAQEIHDLGVPGLNFKDELRRAYPMGELAGYVVGAVNIDNKGIAGIERHIDTAIGVEGVHGATLSTRGPVRLALDVGVQHALEDELETAVKRYAAKAAAGLVLDVTTGEVLASGSLPGIDPMRESEPGGAERFDRISGGTFELGSVFKMFTLAMVLDGGLRGLDSIVDVTEPLVAGRFTITDSHAAHRPLTVTEVFTHSSNVGAGVLALEAGPEVQRRFLDRLGLTAPMTTELGPVAPPQVPGAFNRTEQITISYGHGIAVAPLQFAAAAASLINGGYKVAPTFLARPRGGPDEPSRERVISAAASQRMCELMRLNVTDKSGTGRRAEVDGYEIGGKTGTAEVPGKGGYAAHRVIASFVGAFPMSAPKYLVLVSLFEPEGTAETKDEVLAGLNAAPTAGRIIARIAPQLGVLPKRQLAELGE